MGDDVPVVRNQFPFWNWDIKKYQSKFPPEDWELCRLFMVAHKTKYSEDRLVQLTEAFYNKGVHGRSYDPKTERLIAVLSVPVLGHVVRRHLAALGHPFTQQIDTGKEIQPAAAPENAKSATEHESHKRDSSQKKLPAKEKKESSKESSNSLESYQNSQEGSPQSLPLPSKEETLVSSKESCSTESGKNTYSRKRLSVGSDKKEDSRDKRSGSPESKRRRSTLQKTPDRNSDALLDEEFRIKKLIDHHKITNFLKGFLIIRDVDKNSVINDDISTVEDSFRRSKFGPCSWRFTETKEGENYVRVSLLLGDEVLAEAEGSNKDFVQQKLADAFITRMSLCAPVIKACYNYFNNGECREVPSETPLGPCWLHCKYELKDFSRIKEIMDAYVMHKDFLETIILKQGRSEDEFRVHDVIDYIEKEMSDKLRYRLAIYHCRGTKMSAICLSQIHTTEELLQYLQRKEDEKKQMDERYRISYCSKDLRDFWRNPKNFKEESSQNKISGSTGTKLKSSDNKKQDKNSATKKSEGDQKKKDKNGIKEKSDSKSKQLSKTSSKKNSDRSHKKSDKNIANDRSEENSQDKSKTSSSKILREDNNRRHNSSDKKSGENRRKRSENTSSAPSNTATEKIEVEAPYSSKEISAYLKNVMDTPVSEQTPVASETNNVGKKKKEELSWVGKENLAALAKSIYLVKFVKQDSTTEDDPFVLLKSIHSLAFNVDTFFAMNQCKNEVGSKMWHVSVVLRHDSGNILVGEAFASDCGRAREAAARDAVNVLQTTCRVIEPNFKYFAEGGIPTFISLKTPKKTTTYEIMVKTGELDQFSVDILLNMFMKDKTGEDVFFLSSDYTFEERERVRRTAERMGFGWRVFGDRSRTVAAEKTQHLCVFKKKSGNEVVQQVITSGGSTDKYSIVTRSQEADHEPVVSEPEEDQMEVCQDESLPGGCCSRGCSFAHHNILDSIVSQFLGL